MIAPDLYAGQVTETVDEGFALCDRIGWPAILGRARLALAGMPAETVLAGLSMGAPVAAALLGERPQTAGLLLLHNTGSGDTAAVRPGLPVQSHIADPDTYQGMTDAGAAVQTFRYPDAGHLFTDPSLPDHDGPGAALARQRSLSFLSGL